MTARYAFANNAHANDAIGKYSIAISSFSGSRQILLENFKMRTEKIIKSTAANAAERLHNGVDAAEEKLDESVAAFSARLASLEAQLRDSGERLLISAKEMSNLAGKQMRTHPLTAFGVAFVAGIAVARLLRR